jgi:hypothetical protein
MVCGKSAIPTWLDGVSAERWLGIVIPVNEKWPPLPWIWDAPATGIRCNCLFAITSIVMNPYRGSFLGNGVSLDFSVFLK